MTTANRPPNTTVQLAFPKRHPVAYTPEIQWTRPNRGPRWLIKYFTAPLARLLARLLPRLLKKLGSYPSITTEEYSWHSCTSEHLLKSLQSWNISIQQIYSRQCKYILIGRKQLRELFDAHSDFPQMFDAPEIQIGRHNKSGGLPFRSVLGMKIIFLPWLDGAVPLTSLEELKM